MARNTEEIRQVAESLLQSSAQHAQSPLVDLSHSQSINTIPSLDYLISENLLAGQRFNGRMSNIRRFFCLFVTFDLLFTGLMWLICVMLNGENIMKALSQQIVHYDIHTSLFDVVLVAFCRFAALLLFYALIYMNHWIIVSLSTALTSMFLIAKVFVYDWPHSSQPIFEVLLILVSFVLSWGEAWFLDYRVFPQESNASRYLITNTDSERAPLIQQYVNGLPSTYTESVANFYSPIGTPGGSVRAFQPEPMTSPYQPALLTRQEENNYKIMASQMLQEAWDILHKKDWKFEKEHNTDTIFTMNVPKMGKIYKLTAYIEVPPRYLLEELFYRVDQIPQWNPALVESHKVQSLDEFTDICYQVSAEGAGGLVSSRDFVTLRHWKLIEDCYIIACKGTDYPSLPETKKYIRGINGTGCWTMQPDPADVSKCYFSWVLNLNLNMKYLVQPVKDKAVYSMMFDYATHLRRFSEKFKNKR